MLAEALSRLSPNSISLSSMVVIMVIALGVFDSKMRSMNSNFSLIESRRKTIFPFASAICRPAFSSFLIWFMEGLWLLKSSMR